MEPQIRERFNPAILAETAARFGVDAGTLRRLASAESFIYAFERNGQPLILRIAHSLRRNANLIRGEVDWINYLSSGGASVAAAVLSAHDKLVEEIDDRAGGHFLATAFVQASGRPPTSEDETPDFIERYGQAIGRMHRLTQTYAPADTAWRRPHWDDGPMLDAARFLPDSEQFARDQLAALVDSLRSLPRGRDSYGLVHQDAHGGNFFVDPSVDPSVEAPGALTFFDFDDCAYTWFANDVAIVLFYNVMGKDDAADYARYFLSHFLRGYARENRFDPAWFAHIPAFLKLRELDLYAVIHRSADVHNLTDPWDQRYMNGRKERIENNVPYIDLDFASLRWP